MMILCEMSPDGRCNKCRNEDRDGQQNDDKVRDA